ncbi:MAG: 1-deoxy-D-xylulose-5-phosphate reductoisomerase [Desulfobacterales bacterium]|nr:1-deoxy-D-xylulose-5-phosphate reductoisomerase [Desulfobacterales bacterium]
MKGLSILGSTGSIGRKALEIAGAFPERFSVKALAAGRNVGLMAEQIRRFAPEAAAVSDPACAAQLASLLGNQARTRILDGPEGISTVAAWGSAEVTLSAIVGAAGLLPTLAAIDAGKTLALANKETLVMAGALVTARAAGKRVAILPVDSEHSAIFQCLLGQQREALAQILLTASGGPFLNRPGETFAAITREETLRHPNWAMGAKITVDSATMMNKGLEVLEARWLFDLPLEMIRVVVHPQSIVHSMAAFRDGSVIAQMGVPDMKSAIAYALSYPERLPLGQPLPDFSGGASLTFQDPDMERFPCLRLAIDAGRAGGTMPAVLNAANEVGVAAFLERRIGFTDIARLIEDLLDRHTPSALPGVGDILAADRWARDAARGWVDKHPHAPHSFGRETMSSRKDRL